MELVVGKTEFTAYANNNLVYSQFRHPVKPILKDNEIHFIDLMTREIKDAKSDDDIKNILYQVYITTQIDSMIRAEFDTYRTNK